MKLEKITFSPGKILEGLKTMQKYERKTKG
jgi:hypothetical protein